MQERNWLNAEALNGWTLTGLLSLAISLMAVAIAGPGQPFRLLAEKPSVTFDEAGWAAFEIGIDAGESAASAGESSV